MNLSKWKFWSDDSSEIPQTSGLSLDDFMHAETLGAPRGKGYEYKMAADHNLPWYGNQTLLGHSFDMGQFAGLSGFMGYPALSFLRQNGLINLCINTVVDEMTRNFIQLSGEGPEAAQAIKVLEDALEAIKFRNFINEAERYNKLFGGAMIFIDTGAPDEQLLEPLYIHPASRELRNFKGFRLIEPLNVFPGIYESLDPTSPNYFKPETWWVLSKRVHKSRLIQLKTGELPVVLKPPYNFFGVPQAQILWDYVIHFNECRTSAARLLTKFSRTVFKTDMDNVLASDKGMDNLKKRIKLLTKFNNDGVSACDFDGEDFMQLNTPLNGVAELVWQGLEILTAVNQSPAVKLLGSSPRGFSTGITDLQNWYDHIASEQEHDLFNPIEKCLDVLKVHYLHDLAPEISWEFVALSEDNEESIAKTNLLQRQEESILFDRGVVNEEQWTQKLIDDPNSGWNNLKVDQSPLREIPDRFVALPEPVEGQNAPNITSAG